MALRPLPSARFLLRECQCIRQPRLGGISARSRPASSKAPIIDKSRILEKPTKFNPPSHGNRRTRPRSYPGAPLSGHEQEAQKTRRYPNMMPPEGTFMHWFLTNRGIHLWISLSTLTALAGYALMLSFINETVYRDQLPSSNDFFSHPFQSFGQFVEVYKMHVAYESAKTQERRTKSLEDVKKREEFLREHGVEPGFLTGTWMDRFGTIENDQAREAIKLKKEEEESVRAQVKEREESQSELDEEAPTERRKKPRSYKFFGITWQ